MDIDEQKIKISAKGDKLPAWFLGFDAAPSKELPFRSIQTNRIDCQFEGMSYNVLTATGSFSPGSDKEHFTILPAQNLIELDLSNGN